jgi:hypothetical protein
MGSEAEGVTGHSAIWLIRNPGYHEVGWNVRIPSSRLFSYAACPAFAAVFGASWVRVQV